MSNPQTTDYQNTVTNTSQSKNPLKWINQQLPTTCQASYYINKRFTSSESN